MTLDLGVPGVSSLSFLFGARLYLEPGDVLVLSWIHSSLYGLPFRLRPRHRGRSGGGRGRGGGGLARSCQLFLQHVDLAVELHVLPGQMFHPTMLHLAFVPMALVCRFDLNGLKKTNKPPRPNKRISATCYLLFIQEAGWAKSMVTVPPASVAISGLDWTSSTIVGTEF